MEGSCYVCASPNAEPCVHYGCRHERYSCADHGRRCPDCGKGYCEPHAIETLDSDGRCENCAYIAAIPAGKLCPTCKRQEIGETIPTCLECFWRDSTDGIGKSVASFKRMSAELAGRTA